jgi:hypothetical protein
MEKSSLRICLEVERKECGELKYESSWVEEEF